MSVDTFCPQRNIDIADYRYDLPQERIALYPLAERDASKLLVWRGAAVGEAVSVGGSRSAGSVGTACGASVSDGAASMVAGGAEIIESRFANLGDFLPNDTLLVLNDTKVVHARLVFYKEAASTAACGAAESSAAAAGARIEIFCLEPHAPADIAQAFSSRGEVAFVCLIGNNKKWKSGGLCMPFELEGKKEVLRATRLGAQGDAYIVKFAFSDNWSFSEVLEATGKVPLPPYIHRAAEASDADRYQTVFARHDGSVAAPTAGLHFTDKLLHGLAQKGMGVARLTLHVGAGTFKPVKDGVIGGHEMHREYVSVPAKTVEALRKAIEEGRPVVPVGTTSMRSLESFYWWGVSLIERQAAATVTARAQPADHAHREAPAPSPAASNPTFSLSQWTPYETYGGRLPYTPLQSLTAISQYLQTTSAPAVSGYTALMIAPGYPFAFCRGLVTNFHQPQSTLLLLVAALSGEAWRDIYAYALSHNFRFLSYGDGCLFWPASVPSAPSAPSAQKIVPST